jgi:hypothetical protein
MAARTGPVGVENGYMPAVNANAQLTRVTYA